MSDEWQSVAAGSVARIEIGGTPAREQPAFWADQNSGHAWASIVDLNSEVVDETAEYISDLGVKSSNVKLIPAGTPIMSFKLTIGRTSLAGRDLYTNEAIAAFFADPAQVDPRFLFHALSGAARSVITDVAIKGATLNKKSLSSMPLSLPPIIEQRCIAEILDTMDGQISSLERVMQKLERSREGFIRDSLCKEDFDQVLPLGSLADIGAGVTLGSEPSGPGTVGRPYLRVANVQDGHLDLREIKFVRVRWSDLSRFELQPGDVLMNEGGDADKLGRGAVWEGQIPGCLHQNHVFRVRCHLGELNPRYLSLVTGSAVGKRYFLSASKQTTNLATINSQQIKQFPVPLRSLPLQLQIVEGAAAFTERIEIERRELAKARLLKSGLMADLLTGRVRVPLGAAS